MISDCGKYVADHKEKENWFEVSTLKEPYRIEGKKTMGYELWEQFSGKLPDVVIYPTGGGVGLIGMCKAFDEMEALGWIGKERPRMVVRAGGWLRAGGRGVRKRLAKLGILAKRSHARLRDCASLKRSATSSFSMAFAQRMAPRSRQPTRICSPRGRELASSEGIFAAPEGAATVVAAQKLAEKGWIKPAETVVLFNTGTGYKYSEAWDAALQLKHGAS